MKKENTKADTFIDLGCYWNTAKEMKRDGVKSEDIKLAIEAIKRLENQSPHD